MPKIFMIKNRLHQQWKGLEALESRKNDSSIFSGRDSSSKPSPFPVEPQQPLPLVTPKKDDKSQAEIESPPSTGKPEKENDVPPESESSSRRFVSFLGGGVPFDHTVMSTGLSSQKVIIPSTTKPERKDLKKPTYVSVITRGPKATTKKDEDTDVPLPQSLAHEEPEQDQPIDYHIPKRRDGDKDDDEEERRGIEQRRSHRSKLRTTIDSREAPRRVPGIIGLAAGHGRTTNTNGGNVPSNGAPSSSGGGGAMHFSGGGSGGGAIGGGAMGGGTGGGGGGGMNPGRDGRQNYGPNSPPSGSLPPFYESLKGGTNGNNFNVNGAYAPTNYILSGQQLDCDTGQELGNFNSHNSPKQYSLLQNATYGLVMKDENNDLELEYDRNKFENKAEHMIQIYPTNYDENIMPDIGTVDSLAGLAFGASNDPVFLDSLAESADFSTFLQKLPQGDQTDNSDNVQNPQEARSQVQQHQQIGQNMENFNDQILHRPAYETGRPDTYNFGKFYQESLSGYSTPDSLQVQLQQQQHQLLSSPLSFNSNGLDLESHSPATMSMPSPGAASCSLDNDGPSQSRRENSTSSSPTSELPNISPALQSRLGLSSEVQLEFVNGGHGIKNPLAIQETSRQGPRAEDKSKVASVTTEDGQTTFCCKVCNKTFALQRLLNRHMKCHSDVKRYLCSFCCKGFNDTFDLKRHTRTHTGVRPYECNQCEKKFTQRCSLESHCLKVHGLQHQYAYKERRTKMYVCEECGHTTSEPEVHYLHLKENHPYSPALLKFYDKRHFKFNNSNFANMLLQ